MKVDVLLLEWSTDLTRDRLVAGLIVNYLKIKGCNVIEGPLQNGTYWINKYRPTTLLLVNTIGAKTSIKLATYAREMGITVVSLYGEGNFSEDRIEQFIWGHNKGQSVIDDYRLVWGERALNLLSQYAPQLTSSTFVGGSVGADNYVINNGKTLFDNKKIRKKYRTIIGVGCWNFCLLNPKDHRHDLFTDAVGENEAKRIAKDGELFNLELTKLVKLLPDTLFLIKEHPHKANLPNASAVEGLECFENVLFAGKDESIINCIKSCDVWLTYESTTALEAWLMGKATALLNPTGTIFLTNWRAPIFEGQPNFSTADEWSVAIKCYQEQGKLPEFESFSKIRKKLLKDAFGFSDGLNHVRVGNAIVAIIESKKSQPRRVTKLFDYCNAHIKNVIWKVNIYIQKYQLQPYIPNLLSRYIVRNWNQDFLEQYMKTTMVNQINFYQKNALSIEDLAKVSYESKLKK